MLGARIESIEGLKPRALQARLRPYIGGSDDYLRWNGLWLVESGGMLHAMGAARDADRLRLRVRKADGRAVELTVPFVPRSEAATGAPAPRLWSAAAYESEAKHGWRSAIDGPTADGVSWMPTSIDGRPGYDIVPGELGLGMIRASHAYWSACVEAGLDQVIDDVWVIPQQPAWLELALARASVLWVGVQCPLETLEQRERDRGDRPVGRRGGVRGRRLGGGRGSGGQREQGEQSGPGQVGGSAGVTAPAIVPGGRPVPVTGA